MQVSVGSAGSKVRHDGPRVAVIGGGITGLAAARQLALSGASVVVLEAGQLGGKLRTSTFAGRPVDEAADAFLARVPWATDLATAIGLGDRLVAPASGVARVFVEGRLVPLPSGHLLGIPTDPDAADLADVLSPAGLARLRTDLIDPGPPPSPGDESIGGFVRRRLGDEVLERLVGPLVGGINAGDVDALSLAAVTPQIDAVARSATPSLVAAAAAVRLATATTGPRPPVFLAPPGGMSSFVATLVDDLVVRGVELQEATPVVGLEPNATGWRVTTSGAVAGCDVDAVILALPAAPAAALLGSLAPTAARHLAGISHSSVALLTLALDPATLRTPLDGSGFLVPREAGLVLTACSWSSTKWAALAPEQGDGTVLVRASAGRADDLRFGDLDDDDLVARISADLDTTMGLGGAPVATRVVRWPDSFPQYAPGHLDRVAEIEADVAQRAPTLAVAGTALRGVGIPASIRSGQVAADQVLATLASNPERPNP